MYAVIHFTWCTGSSYRRHALHGRDGVGLVEQILHMTGFSRFGKLVSMSACAVTSLLGWALIGPPAAQAGCSHPVTSRTGSAQIPFLSAPLILEPAEGVARLSEPLSVPPRPRTCSGAWCSRQPAAPAVPAGVLQDALSSWAWYTSVPGLTPPDPFSLASEMSSLRTVRRASAVFHPPRLFPLT
jgi:hypothetical protein